jgi:hypothetical protein
MLGARRRWGGSGRGQSADPGAYNVAAQLLANEEGIDENPPWARVHLIDVRWPSLGAGRLGSTGQIAVTIEESSPVWSGSGSQPGLPASATANPS